MYAVMPFTREFKGKKVIVRGHGDTKHVRALLYTEGRVAFVCELEAHEAITQGEMKSPIFGFPLEDVYEWTAEEEFTERPWVQATSLATRLGRERVASSIRAARARKNRPEAS